MHFFRSFILAFCAIVLIAGCSSTLDSNIDLELEGSFSRVGAIPAVSAKVVHNGSGIMLAGTDEGVFKKQIGQDNWMAKGLEMDTVDVPAEVVDFVVWDEQDLMAVVFYEEVATQKPTLFRSTDGADTWSAVDLQIPNETDHWRVSYLEKQPGSHQIIAYARGKAVKSMDKGQSWEVLSSDSYANAFFEIAEFHPQIIWEGGFNQLLYPALSKSEDGGETWTVLNNNIWYGAEAVARDVVVHPDNPDYVLAGTDSGYGDESSVIRKSTDGGQHWETVYTGVGTFTLIHSARNPQIIYASGVNLEGSLFFLASGDFGETWELVKMEGEPLLTYVNDMISVMEDGREVLYFATEKGVYKYTFKE